MSKSKSIVSPVVVIGTIGVALAAFVAYKQGVFSKNEPTLPPANIPTPTQIGQQWQSGDGTMFESVSDGQGGIQWTQVILGGLDLLGDLFGGANGNIFGGGGSSNFNIGGGLQQNMGGNPYMGNFNLY